MRENITCQSFDVWVTSLRMIISGYIHLPASVHKYLCSLNSLAIVNRATVNRDGQLSSK